MEALPCPLRWLYSCDFSSAIRCCVAFDILLLSFDACDSLFLFVFCCTVCSHETALPLSATLNLATTARSIITYYRLVAINLTTRVITRFMTILFLSFWITQSYQLFMSLTSVSIVSILCVHFTVIDPLIQGQSCSNQSRVQLGPQVSSI